MEDVDGSYVPEPITQTTERASDDFAAEAQGGVVVPCVYYGIFYGFKNWHRVVWMVFRLRREDVC